MIDGLRVLLVKPTTFMNLSGTAVELILEFENLGIGDLLVVHDEMDLQPGKAKMRVGGNAAGHQGVASVIKAIGKDFARLKIGIGRPVKSGEDAAISWVLGTMDHEEKLRVLEAMPKVAEAMTMWLFEGPEKTMTWFNKALK
jgi:PTH1 family peptidyl-tRNA hydrolase